MEEEPQSDPLEGKKIALIEKFKEGDPEAALLMQDWCHEEQAKLRRREITPTDYYLSKAEIYREGGLYQEAAQAFDRAADVARDEGKAEVAVMCIREADRMRNIG